MTALPAIPAAWAFGFSRPIDSRSSKSFFASSKAAGFQIEDRQAFFGFGRIGAVVGKYSSTARQASSSDCSPLRAPLELLFGGPEFWDRLLPRGRAASGSAGRSHHPTAAEPHATTTAATARMTACRVGDHWKNRSRQLPAGLAETDFDGLAASAAAGCSSFRTRATRFRSWRDFPRMLVTVGRQSCHHLVHDFAHHGGKIAAQCAERLGVFVRCCKAKVSDVSPEREAARTACGNTSRPNE